MKLLLLFGFAFGVAHSKDKAMHVKETRIKSSAVPRTRKAEDAPLVEKVANKELKDIITDGVAATERLANKELGISKNTLPAAENKLDKVNAVGQQKQIPWERTAMIYTYAAYTEVTSGRTYQITQSDFNSRFAYASTNQASTNFRAPPMVKVCWNGTYNSCLWYRRFTDIDTFDAYNAFLCSWNTAAKNTLGVDYGIYTSESAAIDGSASTFSTSNAGSASNAKWQNSDCGAANPATAGNGFPGPCQKNPSSPPFRISMSTSSCIATQQDFRSTGTSVFIYEAANDVRNRRPAEPSQIGMLAWYQSEFINFEKYSTTPLVWPSSASYYTASDDLGWTIKPSNLPAWTWSGPAAMAVRSYPGQVAAVTGDAQTFGASQPVKYINGSQKSAFRFGTILNGNFTICSVTRYTGNVMGRLLRGTDTNFLHGHWNGNSGVAYYSNWVTNPRRNANSKNWVVLCGGIQSSFLMETGKVINGALQVQGLAANVGGCCWADEPSEWAVMELAVWNRKLSDQEMQTAAAFFQWKLEAGTELNKTTKVVIPKRLPTLVVATSPASAGMVAWFKSENANNGRWSGLGSNEGRFLQGQATTDVSGFGRGAYNTVKYVSGTNSSQYSFGAVLAETHTICSISRYNTPQIYDGSTSSNDTQGSILIANGSSNYTHGHYRGFVGVAIYDNVARTPVWNKNMYSTHWVVLCGSNGGGTVYDGQLQVQSNFQASPRPAPGNRSLVINPAGALPEDKSSWSVMEVIVWNRVLSAYEMSTATRYLQWKLRVGTGAASR